MPPPLNDLYEIFDERFRAMILPNAGLEVLGDGFRWLEGPGVVRRPPVPLCQRSAR